MKKRNHVISVMMVFLLAISMGTVAFAAEGYPEGMHNVSTVAPLEIDVYGLGRPSTDEYVNLENESLTFAGKTQASTLYSNKHFTGKEKIGYSITNKCDSKLTVKFYTSGGWFKSKKICGRKATLTGTLDGFDKEELYYLTFSAPSHFSGSVY